MAMTVRAYVAPDFTGGSAQGSMIAVPSGNVTEHVVSVVAQVHAVTVAC
jgi:hypothetical protein